MHIRHTPNQERRQHRRQEKSRYSPKRTLRNTYQRAFDVAGFRLANRLQGADVASYEGEDGDADAALEEDADYGPLEDARGEAEVGVFGF